jgi:uncharacterized protein
MSGGSAPSPSHPAWMELRSDCVIVRIRAKPRSSRRGVIRVDPDSIVVGIGSAPERGRANAELEELIARAVGLPRSTVTIVRGATSRLKVVQIATSTPSATSTRLLSFLGER